MQTVIGLGNAGCNIAQQLSAHSEYNALQIDVGLAPTSTSFDLPYQTSPEFYEENVPDLSPFLGAVLPETLLITSCGMVSGAALQILQQLHNQTKLSIMYIVPDGVGLSPLNKLQNNLLFNVFQQYARSAVFEKIILVDNKKVSGIIGDLPILKYWNRLNQVIASTYHMVNVFEHSKAAFTTFSNRLEVARISTIGAASWKKNEENLFFELDIPREKRYYYAIPQNMLEEDATLMTKIQNQVKKGVEHDKMKATYGIYSTQYTEPYVYCESNSSLIQKLPAL